MNIPRVSLSQFSHLGVQQALDRLRASVAAAGLQTSVVWAPGQAPGGSRVQTWEQVMAAVASSQTPLTIWIDRVAGDPPLTVPPGVYEMKNATIIGRQLDALDEKIIILADGAVLRNLRQLSGSVGLLGNPTAAPCLEWDPISPFEPPVLLLSEGAVFSNAGTHAMVDVTAGFVLVNVNRGGYIAPPVPAAPGIALADGSMLILFVLNGVQQLDDTFLGGTAASVLLLASDGTLPLPLPALPMFAGLTLNAGGSAAGGGGPTALRPLGIIPGTELSVGTTFYDTTIVKPVWWDGTQWVDVNGVPS
jgi:hypothetical protein